MTYVYLLWTHGEYGPEGLKATTSRPKIIEIAKQYDIKNWMDGQSWFDEVGTPIPALEELLKKTDKELVGETSSNDPNDIGIYNLMGGWGGLHFQIVELIDDETV